MELKRTYKIFPTGYHRYIYYYIDNKRVSSEKFYDTEFDCQVAGKKYNSSVLYTDNKSGRTIDIRHYN